MKGWDSNQYAKFEKERTQPSVDLIHRIQIDPQSILDVGCGPGNSTNQLAKFFPSAKILGVDSSDNMLEKAEKTYPQLQFCKCTLPQGLESLGTFDLIFSNACLHWIPDHPVLLPQLMEKLNPGGCLAVQMPLTQNAAFYRTLYRLTSADKWKKLSRIQNFHNLTPEDTYDVLTRVSDDVAIWETAYYHIVSSHSAVIDWYKGSGLKPYLDALTPAEEAEFLSELSEKIQAEYPMQADGKVLLKMPRFFFTAMRK